MFSLFIYLLALRDTKRKWIEAYDWLHVALHYKNVLWPDPSSAPMLLSNSGTAVMGLVMRLLGGTIVGSTYIELLSLKAPLCACTSNQVVKQSLLCAFTTGSNIDRWHSVWHQRGQGKWRQGEKYKEDWESTVFGERCINTNFLSWTNS